MTYGDTEMVSCVMGRDLISSCQAASGLPIRNRAITPNTDAWIYGAPFSAVPAGSFGIRPTPLASGSK